MGILTAVLSGSVTVASVAWAQGAVPVDALVSAEVRTSHTVQIAPHTVILTPGEHTATLTLTNPGDSPAEADVVVQFAYPYFDTADTALFADHHPARDTVVANPQPTDRYAGRWITGVPRHVSLRPREARQVTLAIAPPAGLADGEYWARVTTIVRLPSKPPKAKDAKASFKVKLPPGTPPPELRDSAEVYYRQGPMSAGVQVLRAVSAIDTSVDLARGLGANPLRLLFRLRPAGPAHFDGYMSAEVVDAHGKKQRAYGRFHTQFRLFTEGQVRVLAQTDHLLPGKYTMHVTFGETPEGEQPGMARVPVTPTSVDLPFEVK